MDTWRRYYAQSLLGVCLARRGRPEEAGPLLTEGYQGLVQRRPSIPAESQHVLAQVKSWLTDLNRD